MSQELFVHSVEQAFGSLMREFGLRRSETSINCVKYCKDDVNVQIAWDARCSYEIELRIGCFHGQEFNEENSYTLGEVILLRRVSNRLNDMFFQASDINALEQTLGQMAVLLSRHATDLLMGDFASYKQLNVARLRYAEELASEQGLNDIRRRADIAWNDRNYDQLITLYSPIEKMLSPSEKMKLGYARKAKGHSGKAVDGGE